MSSHKQSFLRALSKSFAAYNEHGARNPAKLVPIHSWLNAVVQKRLGKGYNVCSVKAGGEQKLHGQYYDKNLDVTVTCKDKIISAISFKFVTSNYKQNANNYFENLLGETANIRRAGVGFAHLLVLRAKTPYYSKNSGGERGDLKKTEILTEKDLNKYVNLFNDHDYPHKPDTLGIVIININEKGGCSFSDLDELEFSDEMQQTLQNLSIEKFIDRFTALCQLKT